MKKTDQIFILVMALAFLVIIRLFVFKEQFSTESIVDLGIVVLITALIFKVFNIRRWDQQK